jgi:ketosteroid isomerase-like protein
MKLNSRIALIAAAALGAALVPMAAAAHSSQSAGASAPRLTDQQRKEVVHRFATAIVDDDHRAIIASTTPGITWSIPGSSVVSGHFVGRRAVLYLADTFAAHELRISVSALTFGVDTVAVELHDTGDHNGKTLDVAVVNVLTISDGKVSGVSGNLSDVASFDGYFS